MMSSSENPGRVGEALLLLKLRDHIVRLRLVVAQHQDQQCVPNVVLSANYLCESLISLVFLRHINKLLPLL